ncbi:hypothetical protein FS842_001781 [Serendipita sp. 407]|nr:hypothetical protein FS842_001781 [Serendipita sp. 407]
MSVPVIIGEHNLTLEIHRRHELQVVPEVRTLLSPVDGWTSEDFGQLERDT